MYITDYKPVALKSLNFSNEDDRAFYTSFDRNQDGVISWVEQNEFLVRTGQGSLNAPAPTGRTPALLVPDTPQGKFYNAIPGFIKGLREPVYKAINDPLNEICRNVHLPETTPFEWYACEAIKSMGLLNGIQLFWWDKLNEMERLLNEAIGQYSFEEMKQIGFAAFAAFLKKMPLVPPEDIGEPIDFSASQSKGLVGCRRLPNGLYAFPTLTTFNLLAKVYLDVWNYPNDFSRYAKTLYLNDTPGPRKVFYDLAYGFCFSEEVALWMTGDNPPLGFYGLSPMVRITQQLTSRFDKYNSGGNTWAVIGPWHVINDTAKALVSRGFTSLDEIPIDYGYYYITGWGEGDGLTHAELHVVNGQWVFRTRGELTGLKAFLASDLFKAFQIAFAVYGIGTALASIAGSGPTLSNIARLTTSVDRLPGVDLGLVGDLASGLSSGLKLAATIPDNAIILNIDELELADLDVEAFDLPDTSISLDVVTVPVIDSELTMFDDFDVYDVPDVTGPVLNFDPGDFNFIDITGVDLGGELFIDPIDIGVNLDEVVVMELGELGFDTAMLGIDLDGSVYDIQGEVTAPTMRTYAASLYVGSDGGIYDIANTQLLSPAQAETAFDEGGIDELTAQTWAASSSQGATFVAQQANQARPASNPAVKSTGILPTFSGDSWGAFLLNAASTLGNFALAREQIQRTGRYTPPGQTSTYGTAYPTRVGVPQAQPDGSVVIRNQDGSVTRTNIDGSQSTIRPGQTGGLLSGVSTNTLLIGGGILAAVLLLRK